MKVEFSKKKKRTSQLRNLVFGIVILGAAIFVVVTLTYRDALAHKAWNKFHSPQAALVLDGSDAKLAMEIGNYYFNGGAYDLKIAEQAY